MAATEYVVLVDKENKEIGREEKILAHRKNLLHRAFSVFIFRKNPQLELLIQQRALNKYHSQGLWTNSCCSHPRWGEPIINAGVRRLNEELGMTAHLQDLGWFHYNAHFNDGLSENEIDHVLVGFIHPELEINPNPAEIHALRWVTLECLLEEYAADPTQFTPWFYDALQVVKKNCTFAQV